MKKVLIFIILTISAIILRMSFSSILPEYLAISLVNIIGSFLYLFIKQHSNNKLLLIVFCGSFTTYSGIYLSSYQLIQNQSYLGALLLFIFNLVIIPVITYIIFNKGQAYD